MKPFIKTKLAAILSHPAFLAMPLTLLILFLLPPIFHKYNGSIESTIVAGQNQMSKNYYVDLDGDGYSERVEIYLWNNNSTSIVLFSHSGLVIEEFNFPGLQHYSFDMIFGDYDNNGNQEIYFFTLIDDDQIYVNQLELSGDTSYIRKRKFVTAVRLHHENLDCSIQKVGMTDLNDDGFKEVLFYIRSGYSLQPRNIFAWDIKNGTILKSPESYAKLTAFKVIDIDHTGKPEIISNCHAPGNTQGDLTTPYHDRSAWLMVFNNQLNFKYRPVEFPGYGIFIYTEMIKDKGNNYLMILYKNSVKGNECAGLKLFDHELKLLKERQLDKKTAGYYLLLKTRKKGKYLYWIINYKTGNIELTDIDLRTVKTLKRPDMVSIQNINDIDDDDEDEILYRNEDWNKIYISKADFSHPVAYSIPESVGDNYVYYSIRYNGNNVPQFSFQQGNKNYLLNYHKNPYYLFRYPFYLVVYLLFAALFFLVQRIQRKRIEQKYADERELIRLQIQTIKNQTDPHFIFNALNSISAAIYREDKKTAYDFLNDFSSLIRAAVVNSDKIQISLEEEAGFIKNYLRLEKLRFKEKFDYKIDIDENVDIKMIVPRGVLQSYIENAIKHGIMHAEHQCMLEVAIKNKKNHLEINIDDNGIGREKAKEYAGHSTGKGLQIMNRVYELYYKLNRVKITQIIEDKKDKDGKALGTRVRIEIPFGPEHSLRKE